MLPSRVASMLIWLNDGLVEAEQAYVHAFDHGLTVGDGVFETAKVVDGVPFALGRHLHRLASSAASLGLPSPDLSRVEHACREVVNATASSGQHRLRITYTAGNGPLSSVRGDGPPTLIVAATPSTPFGPGSSCAIAVVPWVRNERGALAGVKSTSYAENVMALAAANESGADEAVFADTQGRLSECTGSNVYVVHGSSVSTPSLSSGCLAGVTRALLLEWTTVESAELELNVLDSAEEIFITSSTRDVLAVNAVHWPDGRVRELAAPGPVTTGIQQEFNIRSAKEPDP